MTLETKSEERDRHIGYLFTAELQFRLSTAVGIAVSSGRQPLDFPQTWTYGKHSVSYDEMSLRHEQAEYAAAAIEHSSTLMMAVAVKDAVEAVTPGLSEAVRRRGNQIRTAVGETIENTNPKPWIVTDDHVATAYHVSRLVRNAYAHAPFSPMWMINSGIRATTFSIPNVIELNTNNLHNTTFEWSHYGGMLALYRLCRFARFKILGDENKPRKNIPNPQRILLQQGNLILEQIDKIPKEVVPVELRPDGGFDLGKGHVLYGANPKQDSDEQMPEPEPSVDPET